VTLPPHIIEIIHRLHQAGHLAFLAGGSVRDFLLNRDSKDHDIATSATPTQIATLFPGSQLVGAHFGVVIVPASGSRWVEVATFRTDGSYGDGRRPQSVAFSTPEQDAQRRDFTINGLFYDPETNRLIDHVGGQADLAAQLIRAIGDPTARFQEDHLRLLRAIRFATTLDFTIDPLTWSALRHAAPLIAKISPERVRDELDRIWLATHRLSGFDLLVDSGLMAHILPEILHLQGCQQPPQFHPEGDVFVHTRLMLSLLPPDASLPLVLSVLLHDIAKPATRTVDADSGRIRFNGHDKLGAEMTGTILRRLKYSNDIIQATIAAVANHMHFIGVQQMRTSTLKRFLARPHIDDELELHRVDCLGSNGLLDNYEFLQQKRAEFATAPQPLIPPPLLTGHDLIALGWTPCPAFTDILHNAQSLQLEGTLTTREEALAWAKTHPPQPSPC
jgi:tRNA nucleotidyltransferase/poly(A) polymerase